MARVRWGVTLRVVKGTFAEARVYLLFIGALLQPGGAVPVFTRPDVAAPDLRGVPAASLQVIVDEGRRQLDRQIADAERQRGRASALLTVDLALLAILSGGARRMWSHGPLAVVGVVVIGACLVLSIGGAAAVLTVSTPLGRTDTLAVAATKGDLMGLAAEYAASTGTGETTIVARVTVFRDAATLAVATALGYACLWPFAH